MDERQGTIDSQAANQARLRVLRGAGILARNQDDFAVADSMFSASLVLSRELGDSASIAEALFWLGSNALLLGDESRAQAMAEESVELYRQFPDPQRAHWIYGPLGTLASLAWRRGDYTLTKALLEERLRHARDASDARGIAFALVSLGIYASQQGDHDHAKELLDSSRESLSKLHDRSSGAAWALRGAARAARARGDGAEAEQLLGQSLRMLQELGALTGIAECLQDLAAVAADAGEFERGAQLFGSAASLREAVGLRLAPADVEALRRELDALRAALGPDRFEVAWQVGRDLSVSDAVAGAHNYFRADRA
jgi:tetratricopeptide (TPR) repeat protein